MKTIGLERKISSLIGVNEFNVIDLYTDQKCEIISYWKRLLSQKLIEVIFSYVPLENMVKDYLNIVEKMLVFLLVI